MPLVVGSSVAIQPPLPGPGGVRSRLAVRTLHQADPGSWYVYHSGTHSDPNPRIVDLLSGIYIQTVGEVWPHEPSRDVKGFNVSRFELCKVKISVEGQRRAATSTNNICLHVHVQALAGAQCCCLNSTLDTHSAQSLKAAAVLGSVFSKNQISEQKHTLPFLLSSLVIGLMLHFSYLHTCKHINTTDANLDAIWQATFW